MMTQKINNIKSTIKNKIQIPWEDRPVGCTDVMWRYSQNPVIGRYHIPSSNSIFNSAVVPFEDGFAGVFRCDNKAVQMNIFAGFSKDGIHWDINHEPIQFKAGNTEMIESEYKYDPRVTWIEDRYWVTWCNGYHGPTIGIAYTFDFKEFFQCENAFLPFNRNGVLFPQKIDGKYAMLSRPSDNGHTPFGDIYISYSPDMKYWGEHRCVMKVTPFPESAWQCTKIGAGSVPFLTDEGWLLFYHGVITTCNGFRYAMGAAILDKDHPEKVLYRTREYLLGPAAPYELQGDVPNVVFPCAALQDGERVAVYYGAADTVVGMAFGYIQEIIDFRRLETGHQVQCIQQIDVSALCNDIIHSFSELAEQNMIQFENVVSENIFWNTDSKSLTKILNNLISNAFKYTSVGGRIRVTVDVVDNQSLRIKVYNTGKGIRQEDIPLIFNRYKVLDGVEASTIKGMTSRNGLGLAICHSMVELLKGEIQIQSEYGSYAEFIVLLPMLELTSEKVDVNDNAMLNINNVLPIMKSDQLEQISENSTDLASSKHKILIVDDNTEMLMLLQEAFSDKFRVVVAHDAEQALKEVKNDIPMLIVTDVMMPGIDGFELTRRLKQNKHTMSVPVVILSAKNSSQEKIAGLDAGADAYIGKPFNIDYLKAVVERLIENRSKMKDFYNTSACAYDFSHGHLVKAEDKEFLSKITEYIEKHVDSESLSLEEVAEYMQVSVRTLYRRFKEMDLESPKDYIKEYRINLAAKLLRTTSLTVQEIMYKTGFANRSHFYKEFSKHFQVTPKDYRNKYNKKETEAI